MGSLKACFIFDLRNKLPIINFISIIWLHHLSTNCHQNGDMSGNPESKDNFNPQEITHELTKLNERVNALSSLMEVSIIISSTLDLDELMELVMEKAQMVMKAEASAVMIIDEVKNVLICPVALGEAGEKLKKIELPIDKGIAGWVAMNGEPLIIPDAYQDPRFNPKVDAETGFRTKSILAAPLKVQDKIIGVAEAINRIDGKAFNEEDLDLFSTFCRQVALAIQNAQIHRLEIEKQKMAQQLEAAKFIQQSFMPAAFPENPQRKFEVAARSMAATEVGGDFYDYLEFENNRVGFTLGDVSGKGIPAALFMARMVSDFRLFAQIHDTPLKVMSVLNNAIVERSQRGMFVTSLYGILDTESGKFTFSNAGHLPLIHVSGEDSTVTLLHGGKGIPLGIAGNYQFEEVSIVLKKGDAVVLISDGVIEAKNSDGEEYALTRTQQALSTPKNTAQEIFDMLFLDIQTFSGGAVQHDDLTIMVIKWR